MLNSVYSKFRVITKMLLHCSFVAAARERGCRCRFIVDMRTVVFSYLTLDFLLYSRLSLLKVDFFFLAATILAPNAGALNNPNQGYVSLKDLKDSSNIYRNLKLRTF